MLRLGLGDFAASNDPDNGTLQAESEGPEVDGTTLGLPHLFGYELLEEIGRGAMGVVYRARQVGLDRIVAVKVLLWGQFASPESARRFEREAQAAGRLHHPNIVATHEYGVSEGQAYLSMDWIQGPNLADLVRDRPFPPARAARCVHALARAVDYAHAQGILHRDLKPSNVLVDAEDQPHLTDFGLAKRLGESLDVTLTGQPLGSPNYMAPEQAAGRHDQIGAAADIYALGAILYHCLTGRPPFLAATISATFRQAQEAEPVSPRLLNPGVPRDLETLCLKCLEKLPARRFPTAGALADELGRFLAGEPIRSRPIGPLEKGARWCRRHPGLATLGGAIALLIFAVVVLGVLALGQAARARRAEGSERKQRHVVEQQAEVQRARLMRSYLQSGDRMLAEGDTTAALLWYVEAFALAQHGAGDDEAHRIRIASILERCPKIEHLLRLPHSARVVAFADGDRSLVTLSGQEPDGVDPASRGVGEAIVWDFATDRPRFPPLPYTSLMFGSGWYKGIGVRYLPLGQHDKRLFTITSSAEGSSNLTSQIHLHDTSSGALIGVPLEHKGLVLFAEFSPDGGRLVSATGNRLADGSWTGQATLWETESGRLLATFAHESPVTAARFSPNGHRVLTASRDGSARLWELPSGRLVLPVMQHPGPLLHAGFDHTGKRLATACITPYQARVWDADTGAPLTDPLPHEGPIYETTFTPDDRGLLSFGFDATTRLWRVDSGELAWPPPRHQDFVREAKFSPDGRWIGTAVNDGIVSLWHRDGGTPAGPPLVHGSAAMDLSFASDAKRLAVGTFDGLVRVWHLPAGELSAVTLPHAARIYHVEYSPDGLRLLTAGADGAARLWDSATGKPAGTPLFHSLPVSHAAFSLDGRRVATGSLDGTARVWDAGSGAPLTPPLRHGNAVWHVAFDPGGLRLVTASGHWPWNEATTAAQLVSPLRHPPGEACVWDCQTGDLVAGPLSHPGAVTQASFDPEGRRILTATLNRTVWIWDAATAKPILPPLAHGGGVVRARFDPTGAFIVTAVRNNDLGTPSVTIWDSRTGLAATPPLSRVAPTFEARFSPDRTRVVTGGAAGQAEIWDLRKGGPPVATLVHPSSVHDVMFSPDGRWIASGAQDGVARLWDATEGDLVAQFPAHSNLVYRVAFSPNGQHIVSASWDGTARIWTLKKETRSLVDLQLLAGLLSGRRIDALGRLALLGTADITNAWTKLTGKYPADFASRPDDSGASPNP
ncbi:MAG: protein kinase [Verrucomicrobiales bacterium]|nr:protein kinase [Verrucomicrobiales bacterium]